MIDIILIVVAVVVVLIVLFGLEGFAKFIGFLVIAAGAWLYNTEGVQWWNAKRHNTAPEYEAFASAFRGTERAHEAKRRAVVIYDNELWEKKRFSQKLSDLRDYLRRFANRDDEDESLDRDTATERAGGRHASEALATINRLSDQDWQRVSASGDEDEIKLFGRDHPERPHKEDIETRINELYSDYDWVARKDTTVAYDRYLQLQPSSPHRPQVERRLIELEIARIKAGEYGKLPPSQQTTHATGPISEVNIENSTPYQLSVMYSGPDAQRVVIGVGKSAHLQLKSGSYTVAASVNGASVSNYIGNEALDGGIYSVKYYIRTERR